MEDARSRQFEERSIELDKSRFVPEEEKIALEKRAKLVSELEKELKKLGRK